jgi:hypothetical protein
VPFLLVALLERPGAAVVLQPSEELSFDTGAVPICVLKPKAARDPKACEGIPVPDHETAEEPGTTIRARMVAIATLGVSDAGEGQAAILSVLEDRGTIEHEPTKVRAGFDTGVLLGVSQGLPAKASVRPPESVLVRNARLTMIRSVVDIDGISPNDDAAFDEHQVFLTVYGTTATYTIHLRSRARSAAKTDALVESIVRTLSLAHPARPDPFDFDRLPEWAKVLFGAGVLVCLIALAIVKARRRRQSTL